VYAVNDISFHPVHGTFSTCGADGTVHFWDKDARTRLKSASVSPALWSLLLTLISLSVRRRARPDLRVGVQPDGQHLRLRGLVRLVQGPLGHDARPPEQDHAARVQGRRGEEAAREAVKKSRSAGG
jgi:hypothetical protein